MDVWGRPCRSSCSLDPMVALRSRGHDRASSTRRRHGRDGVRRVASSTSRPTVTETPHARINHPRRAEFHGALDRPARGRSANRSPNMRAPRMPSAPPALSLARRRIMRSRPRPLRAHPPVARRRPGHSEIRLNVGAMRSIAKMTGRADRRCSGVDRRALHASARAFRGVTGGARGRAGGGRPKGAEVSPSSALRHRRVGVQPAGARAGLRASAAPRRLAARARGLSEWRLAKPVVSRVRRLCDG